MKFLFSNFLSKISFILLIAFSSSKNNYYLTDFQYSEDGTVFNQTLIFKGEFDPSDYHYDWTRPSDL